MYSKLAKRRLLCILAVFWALIWLFTGVGSVKAVDRAYHYEYINVDINILENSDMRIKEVQAYNFTSGDFHYGFRGIPTDKLVSIDNVEVWEGDRQYSLNPSVKDWIDVRKKTGGSPGGDNYAYATWMADDKFWVGWWFPETTSGSRTIELRYTVHGGLRINSPSDQLYWKAIFGDRDTYVD